MSVPAGAAPRRASRSSMRLAAGETGLTMVRQFAIRATMAAGWSQHLNEVAMLTSELATNAVLHGERPIAVTVEVAGSRLRVEVMDAAPSMPVQLRLRPEAENGRGLAIVAALAHQWGAERLGNGKVVWAELWDEREH
jgi:anti-sigma regulatory factor (Ser/Thr protein kinase)